MIIKDDRTIKEIITNLREKYPDFEWHIIPFSQSTGYFVNELKEEIGENNRLFSYQVYAIARCGDDVLYVMRNEKSEEIWRIYHLTYSSKNIIGFPKYKEFQSCTELGKYIQNHHFW